MTNSLYVTYSSSSGGEKGLPHTENFSMGWMTQDGSNSGAESIPSELRNLENLPKWIRTLLLNGAVVPIDAPVVVERKLTKTGLFAKSIFESKALIFEGEITRHSRSGCNLSGTSMADLELRFSPEISHSVVQSKLWAEESNLYPSKFTSIRQNMGADYLANGPKETVEVSDYGEPSTLVVPLTTAVNTANAVRVLLPYVEGLAPNIVREIFEENDAYIGKFAQQIESLTKEQSIGRSADQLCNIVRDIIDEDLALINSKVTKAIYRSNALRKAGAIATGIPVYISIVGEAIGVNPGITANIGATLASSVGMVSNAMINNARLQQQIDASIPDSRRIVWALSKERANK